jgi:MtrB/PioB family decaheme-associated outer membrane protein
MHKFSGLVVLAALVLVAFPLCARAQDEADTKAHGSVDFGVRFATGEVDGRPDLPFDPALKTSKFNEYRDVRDGFYVRRFDVKFDDILHTKNYVSLQSQRSLYRDQSYLATFGSYGKFRVQFRYDEIPHIYSNTTRTLFTQTSPGVWSFPSLIRQTLQAGPPLGSSLQAEISSLVVPQFNFITPQILRRAGKLSVNYQLTRHWGLNAAFMRESQKGLRPIGTILNSSPSASAAAGFGAELPEPINYFNNWFLIGLDYGRHSWVVQAAYIGSYFQQNVKQMTWDNPFRLTTETPATPLTGRMTLYPNNHADYFNLAAGADIGHFLHATASITPGWLRQNDSFLPYSTNTAINTCGEALNVACTSLAALPVASLDGNVQTLAMNYTLVTNRWKNFEIKTNYRQYDYNDNTASHTWTPVQGDVGVPTAATEADNTAFGFNRKTFDVSGNYYFGKRSSARVGYQAEWMDRTNRDAAHSFENTEYAAVDWSPLRDLVLRLSYRHSDRKPDDYQNDQVFDQVTLADVTCTDPDPTFTNDQRCHRRFDESARLRDRADAFLEWDATNRITLTPFAGTVQNNYNRRGGSNSPVPLNFIAGTTSPYYLYGLLKDISYNYGVDFDFTLTSAASFFAEYSHERYYQRMISRNRTPPNPITTLITACTGCDSANNDWESTVREPVDIYTTGFDFHLGKKIFLTTYYSLAAGKANVDTRFLGDPTIATGPDAFTLKGTNAASDYPETINRTHEVALVLKYRLTDRLTPRLEYRYNQWDNRDYQTSEMTPYMGCVSAAPPAPLVLGCTNQILDSSTSPTPNPGAASPFYPGFVVGDPSAARYLFLGVDQPSYHAHTVIATLEYRF